MFPHASAIFPILLLPPHGGHAEHIGSGVHLRVAGRSILLTAAHVTDHRHRGSLCIPGPKGVTKFAGSIGFSLLPDGSPRNHDRVDVGYLVPITDSDFQLAAEYAPLELETLDLTAQDEGRTFHLVAGFPLARKWAKFRNGEHIGSRLNFVGLACTASECAAAGYDPITNLLVEYHINKAIYPEGDRANPPSPRGMSGGGVFQIGVDESGRPDSSTARLVGIMHTFDEREHIFVATRLDVVLRLLAESLPTELRRHVDA